MHAKDEDGILAGMDMMSREEAVKALVSKEQKKEENKNRACCIYYGRSRLLSYCTEILSALLQKGIFLFVVTNTNGDKQEFLVEMRRAGTFYLGKGPPKTKPDVTISVADKDMVNLSTGKMNVSVVILAFFSLDCCSSMILLNALSLEAANGIHERKNQSQGQLDAWSKMVSFITSLSLYIHNISTYAICLVLIFTSSSQSTLQKEIAKLSRL